MIEFIVQESRRFFVSPIPILMTVFFGPAAYGLFISIMANSEARNHPSTTAYILLLGSSVFGLFALWVTAHWIMNITPWLILFTFPALILLGLGNTVYRNFCHAFQRSQVHGLKRFVFSVMIVASLMGPVK